MTQNNLGNALQELGTHSAAEQSAQYLAQSVAVYRSALEVRTREQLPQDWAGTQYNLANALQELARHSSGEESVRHLNERIHVDASAPQLLKLRGREEHCLPVGDGC